MERLPSKAVYKISSDASALVLYGHRDSGYYIQSIVQRRGGGAPCQLCSGSSAQLRVRDGVIRVLVAAPGLPLAASSTST